MPDRASRSWLRPSAALLAIAAVLLPHQAIAQGSGVAGTWNVTFRGELGTGTVALDLKQSGKKVTGVLHTKDGTRGEVTGTFDGKTLVMSRDTGVQTIQRYKASVNGTRFTGTFVNEGKHADRGSIEGVRQASTGVAAKPQARKSEGLLGALDDLGKAVAGSSASVAGSLKALGVATAPGATPKASAAPAKAGPANKAAPAKAAAAPRGSPSDPDVFVSVAPLPLDLGDVRELSRLRSAGSAAVMQGGLRVLSGEKARARLATDLSAFPAPAPSADADALTTLLVEAAAARDAKAQALLNVDAAWQEAVLAAAYDDENATRQALEQVDTYVRTARSAQARLVLTAQQAKKATEQAESDDPRKLREQARANHARALAETRRALKVPAAVTPSAGPAKGYFKLVGASLPPDIPRDRGSRRDDRRKAQVSGAGPQAKVMVESPEFQDDRIQKKVAGWWQSLEWTVPTTIVPGKPASFSLTAGRSQNLGFSTSDGDITIDLGGGSAVLAAVRVYGEGGKPSFPNDRFDLVVPEARDVRREGNDARILLPVRDPKALWDGVLRNEYPPVPTKTPQQIPVIPYYMRAHRGAMESPLGVAEFKVKVTGYWIGYVAEYRYRWVPEGDRADAGTAVVSLDELEPFPFHVEKEKQEEWRFREANIAIIRAALARDQQQLDRTADPRERASLEWRLLQGESDLQAEEDLLESLRTGETVRTRSPFDDFAHDRFVAGIRENQVRLESFQRAQVAIPRLIALLPPDQQASARDFAERQMTAEARARMDPAEARRVADALSKKVMGYWQGESARNEEAAVRYDDYLKRAETVKLIANVTTLVGGLGAPSPSLAAQIFLSSAEGYVEGGPAGAVQEAVAFYSAPLYAAAEAFKAYPEGGFYGAGSAAAIGFVKSKLSQLGVAPAGQAAARTSRLTVKELFASAEFKQAQQRGRALVDDFQRSMQQLAAARTAGRSIPEVRALERVALEKAAIAHSDIHAKAFLKYKADAPLQQAFVGQVDAIHYQVEARFHQLMADRKWNQQRLLPIRNASSAGTVGMDFDIRLVEDGGTRLLRDGRPTSLHQWQRDAQAEWARAYKQVTGRDAGHALENVTTSLHPEAYKDLAWIGLRPGPVDPAWARQAADVTRYKATEILTDTKVGGLDHYTRLYEASRGTAKDIKTKLLARLGQPGAVRAGKGPDAAREAEARRKQLLERWTAIHGILDRVGRGDIDPIHADREVRLLTGGYSIPQVLDQAATLIGEAGRT